MTHLAPPEPAVSGRIVRDLAFGGHLVAVAIERLPDGDHPASAAGSRLAEQLAADCLHLPRAAVRVAALSPTGRPIVRVRGHAADVAVSISHAAGLVAAGASVSVAVGLDIVDPADAGRGLDAWFTPDELALVPDDEGLVRGLLWAAKEAAFKAARLDTELRRDTVAIGSLTPHGFAWSARTAWREVEGTGRFIHVGRRIVAVAAAVGSSDQEMQR
jgi:phosphopantetheinyl transferase (holo-ACP synthase)